MFFSFMKITSSHSPPLITITGSPHVVPLVLYRSHALAVRSVIFMCCEYPIKVLSITPSPSRASTVALTEYAPYSQGFNVSGGGGGSARNDALFPLKRLRKALAGVSKRVASAFSDICTSRFFKCT